MRARILRSGGRHIVVASVPSQLREPDPARAIAEEEAAEASPDRQRSAGAVPSSPMHRKG